MSTGSLGFLATRAAARARAADDALQSAAALLGEAATREGTPDPLLLARLRAWSEMIGAALDRLADDTRH